MRSTSYFMRARAIAALATAILGLATPSDQPRQTARPLVEDVAASSAPPPDPSQGVVYICPMDPDVRAHAAGKCRRCGMALVAGVPDPVEFHLDVRLMPATPAPGRPSVLQFLIRDPWKDRPVTAFNVVHERYFHAFVVSEDLQFFVHGHPTFVADGVFQYPVTLPGPGVFRVLGDFYPAGATPQLASDTVIVPGTPPAPVRLARDYSTKIAENLTVSFATVPEQAVATQRTQLRFTIAGAHPLERYLGAWAHMLLASGDLIDMMHEHPLLADGGPKMEFEITFPRPGIYRLWLQVQSDQTVNTVHFDVPVGAAPSDGTG
jgi:hypothetical protein